MWIFFFIISLGIVIPAIKDLFDEKYKLFTVGAIEVVLFVIIMFLASSLFTVIWVLIVHSRDKTSFCSRTVKFIDDKIISESEIGNSEFNWTAIQRIEKSLRCIYVYLTPAQAYILPKRYFKTKSDFNKFYEGIESIYNQYRKING